MKAPLTPHADPNAGASAARARRLRLAWQRALDPWLPRACALCATRITQPEAGLCRHCRLALPGRERRRCPRCGLGLPGPGAGSGCPACAGHSFGFDATAVLADYQPPLDRLIGALKFRGQLAIAEALGLELSRVLRRWQANPPQGHPAPIALVVPVPLAAARWRERGYDQAHAIARALARRTGIALSEALVRQRDTVAQTSLALPQRLVNLDRAFASARPGLRLPADVALVDDVMTTGATLSAAALALKAAGARRVVALVVARTG